MNTMTMHEHRVLLERLADKLATTDGPPERYLAAVTALAQVDAAINQDMQHTELVHIRCAIEALERQS